jgi:L-ascorbate metabolism protein UlaG (beta-lactamase superfamily)
VGGVFTIDPETAVSVIHSLEPSIVIPMHYKTDEHEPSVFSELKTLHDFAQVYGMDPMPEGKFSVEKNQLPEETQLVFLSKM